MFKPMSDLSEWNWRQTMYHLKFTGENKFRIFRIKLSRIFLLFTHKWIFLFYFLWLIWNKDSKRNRRITWFVLPYSLYGIGYTVKSVQGIGIRLENFSNFESWIKTFLRIVQILAVKEGIFIFNFDKSFSNRNTGNPKTSQVQANFWNVQKELTDGTIQLKKFSKGIWKKNASKNRVIFTKWMKLMIIGLFREKNGSFIKNVMKK